MNTFPFQADAFSGNLQVAILVNLLIYAVILLGGPSAFVLGLSLIKPKIKAITMFYIYAFGAAVFIILGTVDLIRESFDGASEYLQTAKLTSSAAINGIPVGIVGGGVLIGLTIVLTFRFFFIKFFGEVHSKHELHGHSDVLTSLNDVDAKTIKAAWLVIFLILSHRMIDGFISGGVVALLSSAPEQIDIGFVVTFNLHILVAATLVFYRQIQYGQKRWKAALYNLYTLLAIVPIMIFGAYIHQYLAAIGWFIPLVNGSGGAMLTFVGIVEIVPEFIHYKDSSARNWYKVLLFFAAGIVVAVVLSTFG
ncbi:ZIP family transporter [[Mycoplasma] testudinis]|uniref:hypothetical protein n=1 Tax=[Mycoplasma] testudinis TaxID=33924 RepID=UPI0005686B29|nr:hypothetical protein [[Mycoplasma] testudinis]